MADLVTMPKLGFDMAEGQLISWAKKEGDPVEKGELLAEIETDKATVEVESNFSGVVRKHLVTEGTFVPVNDPIAVIGTADEDIDLDALGGSSESASVDTPTPAISTPETSSTLTSTSAPTQAAPATTQLSATNGNLPGGVKASPLARNIAEDKGIDLNQVTGTGPGGRVVKRDVENYTPTAVPIGKVAPSVPAFNLPGLTATAVGAVPVDQRVPLTRLRQAIGRRMMMAKTELPHFYVTHAFDMAPVMAMRKQSNTMLEGTGEKLSVNDFLVKATALALREFPNLNASLDGDAVKQHGHVNIGNAVAVEGGLLVVVCHDADLKSLRQISMDVQGKAARARDGNVKPDDVEGSTFSISNLGMYDVDNFFAIINPPEVAILAVGSAMEVPVVENGAIGPGWRMKASISVDHRVSDGAEAAQFMQALARYIEHPLSLML
jgi:pyruvate dehydrogenase E2 component (dihydrolipoamide acetyltransferase)